jgi:hypothetical protein
VASVARWRMPCPSGRTSCAAPPTPPPASTISTASLTVTVAAMYARPPRIYT